MANLSNINNKFLVTTTGEVLIGQTSNNGNRLQITGADGASYIYLKTDVATTGGRIGFNGDDLRVFNQQASGELQLGTAGTSRVRISNSLVVFPTITELRGDVAAKFAIGNMGGASSQMMVSSRGFLTLNVSNTGSALDATERMRIDSAGNVGIGTSSPNFKLDIANAAASTATYMQFRNGTTGTTSSDGTVMGIDSDGDFLINNQEVKEIKLYTNDTERMRINSTGKVTVFDNISIGGFAGTAKLQVNSTTNAGGVSVAAFLVNSSISVGTEVRLAFAANTNDDIATGRYSYISTVNTSGSNGQAMTFATNISGESAVERLRINSTGSIYPPIGPATGTTYYGYDAGLNVGSNSHNTYYGYYAGRANTGTRNTFIGSQVAYAVTNNVNYSVIIGYNALKTAANTAESNVIIGDNAMGSSSGASNGIVIGQGAANLMTGNNNTVVGCEAYRSATTGTSAVIIGYQAGYSASAIGHVIIGWRAGYVNQANSNVYIGQEAGRNNTSGASNVFIGVDAGYANATGSSNTYVGTQAGTYHTGGQNTSFGHKSLFGVSNASSGSYNTAVGFYAGYGNKGTNNTCLGAIAGRFMLTGEQNTIVGSQASDNNDITGNENVVLGFATAQKLTSGSENTILGSGAAITGPITGSNNVFVGRRAAYSMGSAAANTIIGHQAGYYLSSGSQNTGVGKGALTNVTSGTNHTTLGYTAGDEITTGTNCIAIGFAAGSGSSPRQMTTNSNEIVIGSNAIVGAYIRVAWTTGSDKRDKINFNNVPHGLDFVNKLKPTSYDLRKERDSDETIGKRKYGFIAQEILELEGDNPVIIDNSDENKLALQDSNLIPILVKAIQELKAEIELLKSK